MMTIQELNQLDFRYVRIRLDGEIDRYENDNFTQLLKFIGEHYPINGRDAIGCAYTKIRKETDRLLHVSWGHNWKLKTSKNEVKSIRFSKYWILEDKKNHYYIRIPYKISYIFAAIIEIVAELEKENPIPPALHKCIDTAYGLSFYSLHIEEYENEYVHKFRQDATRSENKKNPARLHDEFKSPSSVFYRLFP